MMQETIDLKNKKIICSKCYNELKPNAYDKNIFSCEHCNIYIFLNTESDKKKYLIINKKSSKNEVQNNAEDNAINEEEIQSVQFKKEKRKQQIIGILKEIVLDIFLFVFVFGLLLFLTIMMFILFRIPFSMLKIIIILSFGIVFCFPSTWFLRVCIKEL